MFASALKQAGTISFERTQILAGTEGFTRLDVRDRLLPWLEVQNSAYVQRLQDKSISDVPGLVLTYEPLLEAVSELYRWSDPTAEDRGCVQALEMVSALPMPESEVLHALARDIGDTCAKRAIELAKNYHIVAHQAGYGLPEPVLFSERVWAKFNAKSAKALSPLSVADRAVLLELVIGCGNTKAFPNR